MTVQLTSADVREILVDMAGRSANVAETETMLSWHAGVVDMLNRWLARGDGVAVYRNGDFNSATFGDRKLVSFGSREAQLVGDAPAVLPDIGRDINWRYGLVGTYRGDLI